MGGLKILATAIIISSLFLTRGASLASAQTSSPFTNVAAFVDFGKTVTFQAVVQLPAPVSEAVLNLKPQGKELQPIPVQVNEMGEIIHVYDTAQNPIRAFSEVQYSYSLRLSDGSMLQSEEYSFDYNDTRFAWLQLESELFQVYWYDRDLAFGQLVINTAQTGLVAATNLLPVQVEQAVRIYIYNNPNDLKDANAGTQPWVTGQAAPDLGVILLSIPEAPEDRLELERQLPHELMHILIYQFVGEKVGNLPVWLVEGLASNAELIPNPEYELVLRQSAANDRLIPLETLCPKFPQDASSAFLAYAESASFVQYLHRTYGSSAIRWMIEQYVNGLGCTEGIETALGKPLSQLEYRWKQEELQLNPERLIFTNLLPYLLIIGILFGAVAVTLVMVARRPHRARSPQPIDSPDYQEE